jgi:hypothetical protein
MSFYKQRLRRLEAHQQQQQPREHWLTYVIFPSDLPYEELSAWLATEVVCPTCRATGCEQLRIGGLLPQQIDDPQAWYERYEAQLNRTPEQRAAHEAAWLALDGERADAP